MTDQEKKIEEIQRVLHWVKNPDQDDADDILDSQREFHADAVEYVEFLLSELEKFNEKNLKLINSLKHYAKKPCIQDKDIGLDIGYIARRRLKEIGVKC